MFLYNINSLMLEILYLKYALNDPLGCRNPRNALEWQNHAYNRGGWACVRSFDSAYIGLTLRMWATNKRKP